MRRQFSSIVLGALPALLILGSSGCGSVSAVAPVPGPVQYVVFVDGSASTGPSQADLWCTAADHLVCQRLRPGDALLIFAITDKTGETAPLCDLAIPTLDPDAGMAEDFRVRKILDSARKDGLEAVRRTVLARVRSQGTHLLDSLRRIPRNGNRRTHVVYLTDARESSPILNLERTVITDQNLQRLLQSVEDKQRWPQGMLADATIRFVLDSPAQNQRRQVNNHQALESFWRPIFEFVGAKLTRFDSRFDE